MEENGPLSNACNDHEHAEVGLKKQKLSKKLLRKNLDFPICVDFHTCYFACLKNRHDLLH